MEAVEGNQRDSGKGMKYLAKEMRLFRLLGVSFREDENVAYKIYSYTVLFCLNLCYPLVQFKEIFQNDFEVVSDMLTYLTACYVSTCKTIVVLRNRQKFRKMLERLESEPFTPNVERGGIQEQKLLDECFWATGIQTPLYLFVGYATLFGNMVYTVIIRIRSSDYQDWEMPFGPINILNITYSPNYELTLLYECLSITFSGSHFFIVDLLMATVLAHISYQFRILQNNIKLIMTNCYRDMLKENPESVESPTFNEDISAYEMEGSTIPYKYLHKHLKQVAQYHLEITNLATDMEHVFSPLLLTIFVGTLGILCFAVYGASVAQDDLKVIINMFAATTTCFQVLFVCYWGEEVVFESQEVARAAYEVHFTGADLRFQKGLALIIRRSQKPTKLTAGKFSDICLAAFTWIVRASYSAFMVVRGNTSNKVQVG